MPLYNISVQAGVLDQAGRADLAAKVTDLHSQYSGVPKNWVHVIFNEFPARYGFTAGAPAETASLTVLIRNGRSADYKRGLLVKLWALLQHATGAPDDQLVIGIQEVPASQAMEMGKVMPDVSE